MHYCFTELRRTEDADVAKSLIAHRLKEDILEKAGKLCRTVADLYNSPDVTQIKHLRCKDHKRPITCVVVSPDCQTLYSSSKDCSIVKWSLTEMKKVTCLKRIDKKSPASVKGHRSAVQCLSISSDGKFLASGDLDKDIHIWNPVTMEWLYTFRGNFRNFLFNKERLNRLSFSKFRSQRRSNWACFSERHQHTLQCVNGPSIKSLESEWNGICGEFVSFNYPLIKIICVTAILWIFQFRPSRYHHVDWYYDERKSNHFRRSRRFNPYMENTRRFTITV